MGLETRAAHGVNAALECALGRLDAQPDPGPGLLQRAFAPTAAAVVARPNWPVVGLPVNVSLALGAQEATAASLGAAALVFFAGADVVDDAQDGNLDLQVWGPADGGWPAAVTAGIALTFVALETALATIHPSHAHGVAALFARTGCAMSLGQYQDLRHQSDPRAEIDEAAYLACIAAKSGSAFSLFASLGARALGAPEAVVTGLEAYGRALGMAFQLASDIDDAVNENGRDRANGLLTLPIIKAWERLKLDDRALLLASWRQATGGVTFAFLLERSGALLYCQARLAALRVEAAQALEGLDLPPELAACLLAFIDQAQSVSPGGFGQTAPV